MPITRRKRANPPEQPENSNHAAAPVEAATETPDAAQTSPAIQPAQPVVPGEAVQLICQRRQCLWSQ